MVTQSKTAKAAAGRSSIYSFLCSIYGSEPSIELIRMVRNREVQKALVALGFEVQFSSDNRSEEQFLEDLVLEYTRLFIGPGPHLSPHESVHRPDDPRTGFLWGDTTVDVKRFIERLGLSYSEDYSGIPDHIAVEFELMHRIVEREEKAWREEDEESARRCLEYERKFLKEHLLKWVPDFCDKVARETTCDFFREMAGLTRMFLSSDDHYIDEQIATISDTA